LDSSIFLNGVDPDAFNSDSESQADFIDVVVQTSSDVDSADQVTGVVAKTAQRRRRLLDDGSTESEIDYVITIQVMLKGADSAAGEDVVAAAVETKRKAFVQDVSTATKSGALLTSLKAKPKFAAATVDVAATTAATEAAVAKGVVQTSAPTRRPTSKPTPRPTPRPTPSPSPFPTTESCFCLPQSSKSRTSKRGCVQVCTL